MLSMDGMIGENFDDQANYGKLWLPFGFGHQVMGEMRNRVQPLQLPAMVLKGQASDSRVTDGAPVVPSDPL